MQCKVTSLNKRIFININALLCVTANAVWKLSLCSWRFVCSIIPTAEEHAQHSHLGEARVVTIAFSQALVAVVYLRY